MTLVTGNYIRPDGSFPRGEVRFTLVPAALKTSGEQVTAGGVVALVRGGWIGIDLVPDPDLLVQGTAYYTVHERVGSLDREWTLVVDGSGPIDLPAMYPGPSVGTGVAMISGPALPTVGQPGDVLTNVAGMWEAAAPSGGAAGIRDTGWLNLSGTGLLNGWANRSDPHLRRWGNVVQAVGGIDGGSATNAHVYTLPIGFRPHIWMTALVPMDEHGESRLAQLAPDGRVFVKNYGSGIHEIALTFLTTDTWPTSLPGTPVRDAPLAVRARTY